MVLKRRVGRKERPQTSSSSSHLSSCIKAGVSWVALGSTEETSGRRIRFVSETQRSEKGVETCVKAMRNRQKTETWSDVEYTRWKSRHFSEEWNRDEKKPHN